MMIKYVKIAGNHAATTDKMIPREILSHPVDSLLMTVSFSPPPQGVAHPVHADEHDRPQAGPAHLCTDGRGDGEAH